MSTKESAITRSYFENYAGRSLPYSKVWKDHSYYDECCKLFLRKDTPTIKSMCVLGAASGEILKEFHRKLGMKAYGCEINSWAYNQIPAAYKRRIRCEDMTLYIDRVKKAGKHFDLIFANSLIYLSLREVKPFLRKLSHVTTYLHFQSSFRGNYCPDPFRRVLKPYLWWDSVLSECGFERYVLGRARTYCWKSTR